MAWMSWYSVDDLVCYGILTLSVIQLVCFSGSILVCFNCSTGIQWFSVIQNLVSWYMVCVGGDLQVV